ncbi:hypothetical protein V7161_06295 [Neobacillus drentensis]|uniref:hypothetical protein n=1 Tax=Bacillales TaxID=1385 RepID=UPI0025B03732|nr:hypothetical protein [Paenibacillus sp. BSR1-1]MDN3019369.1 hypothetical protein [Paenibacillus sp. BSR1-1]
MRFLFRFFISKKAFLQKITELEKKISMLEANLHESKTTPDETIQKENQPTIKIEHLQVDKIIIEHLDYANNFGQLGIKDLSGKLNIGTSYEGDLTKLVDEKIAEKLSKQAKVNLKAKKED